MMSQQRETKNYIWNQSDVLGYGATSTVFKATHKDTGEWYAAKALNQQSETRHEHIQKRESEVLRNLSGLNHDNIVRLLANEKETISGRDVLIMELCTGGSLFDILDAPENSNGIEENEFKQVLNDVANGMKHLHDKRVVHRDIKPGNIMRYINKDGRSIYKLIDFGAARKLPKEEQFLSLYGTEEYLFPEMYERAVLKIPTGKQFSATVDLWSLGVTLYHVATGQLPFRPFEGRKNKDVMHKITSGKESGVISGVQNSCDGQIVWSRDLPSDCQLSQGMKQLITPVLARLLENNSEKMMNFDDFFKTVEDIVRKHVIYVFDTNRSCILHIYANQADQFAEFQKLVAEQSNIQTSDQQLLFENQDLEQQTVRTFQKVSSFLHTSKQNPVYLFSSVNNLTSELRKSKGLADLPQFSSDASLHDDVVLAKKCCAVVHSALRYVMDFICKQQLIGKAARMYHFVLSHEIERRRKSVGEFLQRVEEIGKKVQLADDSCSILMSILSDRIKGRQDEGEKEHLLTSLKSIFRLSSITSQKESFKELLFGVKRIKEDFESLHSQVSRCIPSWIERNGCKNSQGCILKSNILLRAVKQTLSDFVHDRNLRELSPKEEQIHKFEKYNLRVNSEKAVTLVHKECFPNTIKMFDEFCLWYSKIWNFQLQLQSFKDELRKLSELQELISENLIQNQKRRHEKLKSFLNELESGFLPVDSPFRCLTSDKDMQELINILKSRQLWRSDL